MSEPTHRSAPVRRSLHHLVPDLRWSQPPAHELGMRHLPTEFEVQDYFSLQDRIGRAIFAEGAVVRISPGAASHQAMEGFFEALVKHVPITKADLAASVLGRENRVLRGRVEEAQKHAIEAEARAKAIEERLRMLEESVAALVAAPRLSQGHAIEANQAQSEQIPAINGLIRDAYTPLDSVRVVHWWAEGEWLFYRVLLQPWTKEERRTVFEVNADLRSRMGDANVFFEVDSVDGARTHPPHAQLLLAKDPIA